MADRRLRTARLLRDFAMVRVLVWTALAPISLWRDWAASVIFVTVLSLLALILSDLAVWQAGRAEVASLRNAKAEPAGIEPAQR